MLLRLSFYAVSKQDYNLQTLYLFHPRKWIQLKNIEVIQDYNLQTLYLFHPRKLIQQKNIQVIHIRFVGGIKIINGCISLPSPCVSRLQSITAPFLLDCSGLLPIPGHVIGVSWRRRQWRTPFWCKRNTAIDWSENCIFYNINLNTL